MAQLQEYKCPCCGGAIAFDSSIQKMKCPFCDTEFEMEALAGYDRELKNEQPDQMDWEILASPEWQAAVKSLEMKIPPRLPVHTAEIQS